MPTAANVMTSRIQQLNDAFRASLSADLGRVVMTSGVACLGAETIAQILNAVRRYDQFDEDIDPYGEHDMGRFTVSGEDYYWKIDYYDWNLAFHSPDPADPTVMIRVLTITREAGHRAPGTVAGGKPSGKPNTAGHGAESRSGLRWLCG